MKQNVRAGNLTYDLGWSMTCQMWLLKYQQTSFSWEISFFLTPPLHMCICAPQEGVKGSWVLPEFPLPAVPRTKVWRQETAELMVDMSCTKRVQKMYKQKFLGSVQRSFILPNVKNSWEWRSQSLLFSSYSLHTCRYAMVREGQRQAEVRVSVRLSQESFIVANPRTNLHWMFLHLFVHFFIQQLQWFLNMVDEF